MPPSPSLFKGVDHVYPFAVVPLVGARIACRFLSSQAQDLHLKKNISAGDTWSRQPKRRSKRRGNEASLSRRTAAETMRLHYVLGGERNTQFPAVSVSS